MIENMRGAKKFANQSLNCSDFRKKMFISQVENELTGGEEWTLGYDATQDYIDSLRREHHVGIGL